MRFKTYRKLQEQGLGGLAGAFGGLAGQPVEPTDDEPVEQPAAVDDLDDTPKTSAVVFDFYGTLFKLKDNYEDILLKASWIDYPVHVEPDFDLEEWQEIFVIVPDSVYATADDVGPDEVVTEEVLYGRYEREKTPPASYIRVDKATGAKIHFGPGEITEEVLQMFTTNFASERFIRVAYDYDAFIMKGFGREASAREKYFSVHAESVLQPEKFRLLHTLGPAINMIKEVDQSTTDVHVVATYGGDEEINWLIADICKTFGFKIHPMNQVHVTGWSPKKTKTHEAAAKSKIAADLMSQYDHVTWVDDTVSSLRAVKKAGVETVDARKL